MPGGLLLDERLEGAGVVALEAQGSSPTRQGLLLWGDGYGEALREERSRLLGPIVEVFEGEVVRVRLGREDQEEAAELA